MRSTFPLSVMESPTAQASLEETAVTSPSWSPYLPLCSMGTICHEPCAAARADGIGPPQATLLTRVTAPIRLRKDPLLNFHPRADLQDQRSGSVPALCRSLIGCGRTIGCR